MGGIGSVVEGVESVPQAVGSCKVGFLGKIGLACCKWSCMMIVLRVGSPHPGC